MIIFDSRSISFKNPFGCVKRGTEVEFNIYTDESEDNVALVIEDDGGAAIRVPMRLNGQCGFFREFSCRYTFGDIGLFLYSFTFGSRHVWRNEFGEPTTEGGIRWQITCYEEIYPLSEDLCGRVMYQIFPDRFNASGENDLAEKLSPFYVHINKEDIPEYMPNEQGMHMNNDFFGGNLRGIADTLDYISGLGVGIIYLNPIFMAFSNHRYDTANYKKVDPMLGTNEDFIQLCRRAHELGIKIILDGVFSHTGADSIYFDKLGRFGTDGAYMSRDSKYKDWYNFRRFPDDYECWWGIYTLPCVNELASDYLDYILYDEDSVVKYWLRCGADGFRLDVADELPDEFLERLYKTVKEEKPDAYIIGEVWEDASNKISYEVRRKYLLGHELDGVMNYVYKNAIINFTKGRQSAERFNEAVMSIAENYPHSALLSSMLMLSTHDTDRILTHLGTEGGERLSREKKARYRLSKSEMQIGKKRLLAAIFLLFTLPGNSCIYYGDEVGMQGFSDPFNRGYFGLKEGDADIFETYKMLAAIKNASEPLKKGIIKPIAASDAIYVFRRIYGYESVTCAVNTGTDALTINLEIIKVLYGNNVLESLEGLTLLPFGAAIFECK